jgi:hypothetical protein
VDSSAPKSQLYDMAKRLDVRGRSTMTKNQLVAALQKANTRSTARVRGR